MGAAHPPLTPASGWEHPVNLAVPWAQESLFGRLSRIGLRHPSTDELFDRELRGCYPGANPLTAAFTLTALAHGLKHVDRLRRFVGAPGRQGLDRLVGADLLHGCEALSTVPSERRFLRPVLRHCPQCLRLGYHSMLFQHLGVARCPGHGVALKEGCPRCQAPVTPTLRSALVKPFECRQCASLMMKTVLPPEALAEQRLVDDLIGDWRRDLGLQELLGECRSFCPEVRGTELEEPLQPRQRLRRHQRHCAWPQFETSRWTRFRQVERELPECGVPEPLFQSSGASPHGKVLAAEATETLAWLVRQCVVDHAPQSHALIHGSWLRPQYIAHDDLRGFAAIPVALHMTMCRYASTFEPNVPLRLGQIVPPYHGVAWNRASVQRFPLEAGEHAALLLTHEILGFFACALLGCVTNPNSDRVTQLSAERLSTAAFCPAWKVQRVGRRLALRVRPRVDQARVLRLLRRYAGTPLRRPVQCSSGSGAGGGSWTYTRWSPRVPPELLHFPAGVACAAEPAPPLWKDA